MITKHADRLTRRCAAALLAALAAAALSPSPGETDEPEAVVGVAAPDFALPDTAGKERRLSSYRGKAVVLEWLNYDCPFVRKHYKGKNMQALQKKYGAKGVVWLSIISSAPGKQGNYPPDEVDEKTGELGATPAAVLLDPGGKVGRMYGARTTPHMFVIDKKGRLAYAGAIDDRPSTDVDDLTGARSYVSEALDATLSGKPVRTSSTKPYGCSVKYK